MEDRTEAGGRGQAGKVFGSNDSFLVARGQAVETASALDEGGSCTSALADKNAGKRLPPELFPGVGPDAGSLRSGAASSSVYDGFCGRYASWADAELEQIAAEALGAAGAVPGHRSRVAAFLSGESLDLSRPATAAADGSRAGGESGARKPGLPPGCDRVRCDGPSPLSTSHIRPGSGKRADLQGFSHSDGGYHNLILSGQLVRLEWRPEPDLELFGKQGAKVQSGGGRRGVVAGFSVASRRRMLRQLAQVPQSVFTRALVLSVTLTYPAEFPSARETKDHIAAFYRALNRRYPGVFGGWKLEPQKRGAPHYHVVLFFRELGVYRAAGAFKGWRREFQSWMAETWYRIVGSGDGRHYRFHLNGGSMVGANRVVELVKTYRQFMAYMGKYVGKTVDLAGWSNHGRMWGIWNRDAWREVCRPVLYALDKSDWIALRRLLFRASYRVDKKTGNLVKPKFLRWAKRSAAWTTFDRLHGRGREVCEWWGPPGGDWSGWCSEDVDVWGSLVATFLRSRGVNLGSAVVGEVPPVKL